MAKKNGADGQTPIVRTDDLDEAARIHASGAACRVSWASGSRAFVLRKCAFKRGRKVPKPTAKAVRSSVRKLRSLVLRDARKLGVHPWLVLDDAPAAVIAAASRYAARMDQCGLEIDSGTRHRCDKALCSGCGGFLRARHWRTIRMIEGRLERQGGYSAITSVTFTVPHDVRLRFLSREALSGLMLAAKATISEALGEGRSRHAVLRAPGVINLQILSRKGHWVPHVHVLLFHGPEAIVTPGSLADLKGLYASALEAITGEDVPKTVIRTDVERNPERFGRVISYFTAPITPPTADRLHEPFYANLRRFLAHEMRGFQFTRCFGAISTPALMRLG